MFPVTPGLLELGNGFVTLELAIAAAIPPLDVSPFISPSMDSSLIVETSGLEGLNTGAEADIFDAFGLGPGGPVLLDALLLGGVLDLVDMVGVRKGGRDGGDEEICGWTVGVFRFNC